MRPRRRAQCQCDGRQDGRPRHHRLRLGGAEEFLSAQNSFRRGLRSEEHTSELQSRLHLVCRLLLEKKKHKIIVATHHTITYTTPGTLLTVLTTTNHTNSSNIMRHESIQLSIMIADQHNCLYRYGIP